MFEVACGDCGSTQQWIEVMEAQGDARQSIQAYPYAVACACGAIFCETPEGFQALRTDGRPSLGFGVRCLRCGCLQAWSSESAPSQARILLGNSAIDCACGATWAFNN